MDDGIFKYLPPSKFDFENFENSQNFCLNSQIFFFTMYTKRRCLQWKWKMGAQRPNSLVHIKMCRESTL